MAMAALRHATRRLLACCQRPPATIHRAAVAEQPRRLLHRGSSAVGRNFSLAQEQRWMLQRLIHGGSPSVGRTYSKQSHPFYRGEPNPNTFMECYVLTVDLLHKITVLLLKVALTGAVVVDCCRSQYFLTIFRVMVGLEPPEKWLGKEVTCHACGHTLHEGIRQQQKTE